MLTLQQWTGRPLTAIRADPWERTLWSYAVLEEKRATERRAERFDLASLVRLAVLDGEVFDREAQAFRRLISAPAPAVPNRYPTGPTQAEILAHYDAALGKVQGWRDAKGNPVEVPI